MHHVLISLFRPSTRSTKNFMVKRNLFLKRGPKTVRLFSADEFREFITEPLTKHFEALMGDGWIVTRVERCTFGMMVENEENLVEA